MRRWRRSLQVGVTSWHHWKADNSRISRMLLILIKNYLFIRKLRNVRVLTGLSIANPNFSEIDFSVEHFKKEGSSKWSFQAIVELVCSMTWRHRDL